VLVRLDPREARELFERALRELDVPELGLQQAVLIGAQQLAEATIAGEQAPGETCWVYPSGTRYPDTDTTPRPVLHTVTCVDGSA
jgi:hypothetical protein